MLNSDGWSHDVNIGGNEFSEALPAGCWFMQLTCDNFAGEPGDYHFKLLPYVDGEDVEKRLLSEVSMQPPITVTN